MTLFGITGSTGKLGGAVARALGSAGVSQRLIVRDPGRAPEIPGAEVATADYGDLDAATVALRGVDVLLMVSASEAPNRREQHRTFIDAAVAAGVKHLVYTSFAGAGEDAVFTLGRDHGDAEAALAESGLVTTLLRDNFYLDYFPVFADEHGVIRGPAGDGRVAAVARADVADAASAVLLDHAAHEGAVYELTGSEAISFPEAVQRMTLALGRPFSFVDETIEEAYASRRVFTDEQFLLDAWVSTYTAIAQGTVERITDDVQRLSGHAPRRLEDVI
ncbi:SDR family oxidoreductase [Naasia lichenicola]|uniref:SDR family oxidoreductase n=1 Tax=Naasia lichenicola TaxID=2565933 RepID=A0A4S4FSA0_9MICO|nr:SDR family oxidoreductase [Naasia lichenicola]THG33168.1 SDR family oxidoreductase [Naasia lichenicola]